MLRSSELSSTQGQGLEKITHILFAQSCILLILPHEIKACSEVFILLTLTLASADLLSNTEVDLTVSEIT